MSGGTVHGPYDTSAAAIADARQVYEAGPWPSVRVQSPINEGLLRAALAAAGVELGVFDAVIAGWLAGWEPATVQVVIGWIERAHG